MELPQHSELVEEVSEPSTEVVEAVNGLLTRLSEYPPALTLEGLSKIIDNPYTSLLVARDSDGRIVGTTSVGILPSGERAIAFMGDVIVEKTKGRKEFGVALGQQAFALARAGGAERIYLHSRTALGASLEVYDQLQFERQSPQVYQRELNF